MRPGEPALSLRMKGVVECIKEMGMESQVAVLENGDCQSAEGAKGVRIRSGVTSVMLARAAESNPSCFAEGPVRDAEMVMIPEYLRLVS